jgi:hypothetical protein
MKERGQAGDEMIIRKPHLAYLSGMKSFFPLAHNPKEFLEAAKKRGAKYLVYSDDQAKLWEGLRYFSDPQKLPKQFKLIYRYEPTNTLIYEITY